MTVTFVITPFTIIRKRTGLAAVQPVVAGWAFFKINKTFKSYVHVCLRGFFLNKSYIL